MKIKEISFSAYSVTDVKRARAFYEGILGLKPASVFDQDGMAFIEYWIGPDEDVLVIGAGADQFKPGKTGATVALEVEDFEKAIEDLRIAKVKFLMEPMETSACHMAMIEDPDANQLMIHRRKQG
jgi:predicted enzyme related to lactoylglutathione lyase